MTTELKRILLVEDNQKDIDLTLAALAQHELAGEVAVVRDGEQALDYLCQRGKFQQRTGGNPSVVLLDLKLPKLNGLEVLAQIKADAQLRTIPVVMLTSSNEEIDLATSYQRGVNAYVVKPVTFSQFVNAVRELGVFWTAVNEPPPGSITRRVNRTT